MMTLAREERTDNFKLALKTLLEAVGDSALDEVSFDPNAYQDILQTTWDELVGLELVEMLVGQYLLTGRGWTAALLTTGVRDQESFKQRLGKLFSTMKGLVKDRKDL